MPDIDIDFDERRRGDMIRYATETLRRGAGRPDHHLRHDQGQAGGQGRRAGARLPVTRWATGSPRRCRRRSWARTSRSPASSTRAHDALRARPASSARSTSPTPTSSTVVDTARGLEGLKRQWGVHAAGVILCREPLLDVIPIQRREQDGAIITQFDMGACEALGLLKMDFLGLRNLTVLDDCLAAHQGQPRRDRRARGPRPRRRRPTYELLGRGDTLGVFQLDGGADARAAAARCSPTSFDDISAVGRALPARPDGRQRAQRLRRPQERPQAGRSRSTPSSRSRWPRSSTRPTALIVYQEQVMAIAQKVAGYSLGQADLLRRAMGKKKKEILDKEYVAVQRRHAGATATAPSAIKTLWDILVPFSDYALQQGAHRRLRPGRPTGRPTSRPTTRPNTWPRCSPRSRDDKDKSALYLNECRRMGIKVLPPDVNDSDANFTPRGTDIRFGLSAIRNVGANVVESIVAHPPREGPLHRLRRLPRARSTRSPATRSTVESLIKAGAFDSLGHTRRGLLRVHADAIDACMETKRDEAIGQFDLFGGGRASDAAPAARASSCAIPVGEWDKSVAARRTSARCSASTSPTTRCSGVEHVLAAVASTARSPP